MHQRRKCEGSSPNSLPPISHFGSIFPWTRDSQCQNSANILAENTPNASKNFSPICLPKPKSFKFLKKSSLWVSVVPYANAHFYQKLKAFRLLNLTRVVHLYNFLMNLCNLPNVTEHFF